jgi:hypothetical protein
MSHHTWTSPVLLHRCVLLKHLSVIIPHLPFLQRMLRNLGQPCSIHPRSWAPSHPLSPACESLTSNWPLLPSIGCEIKASQRGLGVYSKQCLPPSCSLSQLPLFLIEKPLSADPIMCWG